MSFIDSAKDEMPTTPSGEMDTDARQRDDSERVSGSPTGAMELASWLHERVPSLRESWIHEIRARGLGRDPQLERVVERLAQQIVRLLPLLIGPTREQIKPHWDRIAELYGVIAAKRGLATGEVVEELHVLRELVIRDLYRDPPLGGDIPLSLREILRLNRALDRAVALASVGYTDALFFESFDGHRTPGMLAGHDVAVEAEAQLTATLSDVESILEAALARSPGN